MPVGAGHSAEYLNFPAKIHCVPKYPLQCLNFLGIGHERQSSFLILISSSVTLEA
jgi:hypothetical protein